MDLRVDNRSQREYETHSSCSFRVVILGAAIDRDGQVTVFRLCPNGQTKGCRAEMRKSKRTPNDLRCSLLTDTVLRKKAFALPTGYYKRVRIYVESSKPLARSSSMGTTWSRVSVTPYLRVWKSLRNDRRRVGAQFRLHLDQASRDISFQKRVPPMVKRSPKTVSIETFLDSAGKTDANRTLRWQHQHLSRPPPPRRRAPARLDDSPILSR
jgi:hypothetical protein